MAANEMDQSGETLGTKLGAWAMLCLFIPTFIGLFDGLGTLAKQLLGWLKTGVWRSETAWDGLHKWLLSDRPSFSWVVPNNILNWVLDGPRWVWLPLFGFVYLGIILCVVIGFWSHVEGRWRKRSATG